MFHVLVEELIVVLSFSVGFTTSGGSYLSLTIHNLNVDSWFYDIPSKMNVSEQSRFRVERVWTLEDDCPSGNQEVVREGEIDVQEGSDCGQALQCQVERFREVPAHSACADPAPLARPDALRAFDGIVP